MTVVTVLLGDAPHYRRLFSVFKRSLQANCPLATLEVMRAGLPPRPSNLPYHTATNTTKLHLWRDAVYRHEGKLVLLDCDAVILGDLAAAFQQGPFDIGYTVRPGMLRLNSGVVFVRCNQRSRTFMDDWVTINDALLAHQPACLASMARYGGVNQAAMAYLLDKRPDCKLQQFHCAVWNSVQETWHQVNDKTRIVHIKSRLRDIALGRIPATPDNMRPPKEAIMAGVDPNESIQPALDAWLKYSGNGGMKHVT